MPSTTVTNPEYLPFLPNSNTCMTNDGKNDGYCQANFMKHYLLLQSVFGVAFYNYNFNSNLKTFLSYDNQ